MSIESWLKEAIKKLKSTSVPTAQLDAEVLLADVLDKDRTWIHAHPEHKLKRSEVNNLDIQINRRMKHEPLAYIRGRQEFFGREFIVSPDTLTPRPETETLVENALKIIENSDKPEEINVVDVGTGSGCIAISVALEAPSANYLGLDISESALEIAKKNAVKLNADVFFKKFNLLSDVLEFTPSTLNLVLANLPYVPIDFEINLAASHEPGFAIYGGKDGLDYYRLLFQQLARNKNTATVLTESLPPQHQELKIIAQSAGFKLLNTQDLIQVFE